MSRKKDQLSWNGSEDVARWRKTRGTYYERVQWACIQCLRRQADLNLGLEDIVQSGLLEPVFEVDRPRTVSLRPADLE